MKSNFAKEFLAFLRENKGVSVSLSMAFVIALLFLQTSVAFAQMPAMDAPASSAESPTETPPMEEMTPPEQSSSAVPEGPVVSSVSVTDITDTSARIDVDSDEMVQGYVEYGTSEQYGMSTPLTAEFSAMPSFILENLTPETLYHYRVIIMDSAGNAAITSDQTFTTLATPAEEPTVEEPPAEEPAVEESTTTEPATEPAQENSTTTESSSEATAPVISNVTVSAVSTSTASISWTTSEPATSDIQYGTTTSYGFFVGKDQTLTTSQARSLGNLTPSTLYHFRIIAADNEGNTALAKDRTFTTAAVVTTTEEQSTTPTETAATGTTTPASDVSDPAPALTPASSVTASSTEENNLEILSSIAALGSQSTALPLQTGTGDNSGTGGLPAKALPPLLLTVAPLDGQVSFDWLKDNGAHNGEINTIIVKKEGTDPVSSRIDGTIIYAGPSTAFTDTDVQNGTEYHYALYSYGASGRFTRPVRFSVIPQAGEEQIDLSPEIAQAEGFASDTGQATDTPLTFSRDLSPGMQGDDVLQLQAFLAGHGYYPEALVTGYFGPLTVAAVVRFQTLNDIAPAVGYVGPLTQEVIGQY